MPGLHVGGKSALALQGVRHNLGSRETLVLWGDGRFALPAWFTSRFPARYVHARLFDWPDTALAGKTLTTPPGLPEDLRVAASERAVLELLYEAGVWAWHRLLHGSAFLWRWFHQMHHSAERLDTWGAFWFSPLDMVGWTALFSLALTLVGLSPSAVFATVCVTTFLSVFQHANVRTPRWLGVLARNGGMASTTAERTRTAHSGTGSVRPRPWQTAAAVAINSQSVIGCGAAG